MSIEVRRQFIGRQSQRSPFFRGRGGATLPIPRNLGLYHASTFTKSQNQGLTIVTQWPHYRYTMRKLGQTPTKHITLRLEPETVEGFKRMADKENPWRAIMRDALKQYLRRL